VPVARVCQQAGSSRSHVTCRGHREVGSAPYARSFVVCPPQLCDDGRRPFRGTPMAESECKEATTMNEHVQCLARFCSPFHMPHTSLVPVSPSRRYPCYATSLTACDDPFLARTTDYLILVMSLHTDIVCAAHYIQRGLSFMFHQNTGYTDSAAIVFSPPSFPPCWLVILLLFHLIGGVPFPVNL